MSINFLQKQKQVQSKRSNILVSNSRTQQNNSNDQSDYEIVIEFELRRQRQKTRILEQRLHNKEVFIQQMKQYQDQLTLAFQKCQQELIVTKKALQHTHAFQRNYQQQIAELKHLVIRLQDQINLRQKDNNRRHYSSTKQDKITQPFKRKQVRSKTLMNDEEYPIKKISDQIQKQILKQSAKITKFIKQFLMMCDCFCAKVEDVSVKERLKISWKWIKQVVKQWNDLKNQKQTWDQFVNSIKKKGKFSKQNNVRQILNKVCSILQAR